VLATNDTGFILVPAGAVRPAVVCSGHYIASHRGARRGGLQAWRERRPGLQVPEVLTEASANIVVKAESMSVISIRPPLRLGDRPSFYRPRREHFTCVPHYFPTCGGVASSAMELTVVLANPAPVGASWRVLCSYRSSFEGGGVVVGCPAAARGPVRGCRQRGVRTRYSGGHGDVPSPRTPTASGMSSHCPAWRCRGGDGRTELTATGKSAPADLMSRRSPM
jgi:hypothetical protein